MKYLTAALILLCSCVTEKVCQRKFPIQADTVSVVVFHDSISYRDTVITIFIRDTVYSDTVKIPCPPPPPGFVSDTATARSRYATARAWFSHPYINLELRDHNSITLTIDSAIREAYYWRNEFERVTAIKEKRRIPTIYRVALWAWVGVIVFILFITIINIVFRK